MKQHLLFHIALFTAIAALSAAAVHAYTINIPDDYQTIQSGIDASSDADTVLVQPGTYYENINFNGKNIVLGSLFITTQDTSYISKTVIDGSKRGSVVAFRSGEDSTAVLCGLTIQRGEDYFIGSEYYVGSGIYCIDSSPYLKNLFITKNSGGWGGGIRCDNSSSIIDKVIITDNISSDKGGGLFCRGPLSPLLMNVTISNNTSWGRGCGIYCIAKPHLTNVIIIGNKSQGEGGGICCNYGNPLIVNVTIVGNSGSYGDGIYCDNASHPIVINTILWENSPEEIYFDKTPEPSSITIAFSNINGGYDEIIIKDIGTVNWLDGNINTNPLFVDSDNYNFSLHEDSPCIDAGIAFYEIDTIPIIDLHPEEYIGSAPDMGAFEFDESTKVTEEHELEPAGFSIYQNFPNPFNQSTTISYTIPEDANVRLVVYNASGQKIETLVNNILGGGMHESTWDAGYNSSGLYFYVLKTETNIKIGKMLLLK